MKRSLFLWATVAFQLDPSVSSVTLRIRQTPLGHFEHVAPDGLAGSLRVEVDANGQVTRVESSSLTVAVASFRSLLPLRDEHVRKHLKASEFPRLEITELKAEKGTFRAMVSVAGASTPWEGTYDLQGGKDDLRVSAEGKLKMSAFGITPPQFKGVGVRDEVLVRGILKALPHGDSPSIP